MALMRAHILVHGRVQGVYYRATAQEVAERLGLSGWVRNRAGGQVEIVAEGPRERVEELLAWCRRGPDLARVDRLDVDESEPVGLAGGFHVRPTV